VTDLPRLWRAGFSPGTGRAARCVGWRWHGLRRECEGTENPQGFCLRRAGGSEASRSAWSSRAEVTTPHPLLQHFRVWKWLDPYPRCVLSISFSCASIVRAPSSVAGGELGREAERLLFSGRFGWHRLGSALVHGPASGCQLSMEHSDCLDTTVVLQPQGCCSSADTDDLSTRPLVEICGGLHLTSLRLQLAGCRHLAASPGLPDLPAESR